MKIGSNIVEILLESYGNTVIHPDDRFLLKNHNSVGFDPWLRLLKRNRYKDD
jgi:hypothetical protein